MALAPVQAALARLFTDAAARSAFLDDPRAAAHALGLDPGDADALAAIAPQALRRFAAGLKAKRALDARKALPLTAKALGASFADHFHAAAATLRADASRPEQAQALAGRLAALARAQALKPAWIGDLARYEAAFIEASRRRYGARLRLFRFPVARIAATLQGGGGDDAAPSMTLGVWARRPGGRLFHRLWRLGR